MEKEKAIEEICEHTNEFQNALLSALDVLEDESEKCMFSEKNRLNHATLIRLLHLLNHISIVQEKELDNLPF